LSVDNSDNETFTLYLPTTYDSKKAAPILFIFSPSGNGKKAVKTFIQSAEVYNHILICSNNSRNGSLERNLNIAQRLFNHAFSNFSILENRIYLAGFSGGARLATAIASVSNQIEGVISCGAGFISAPNYLPSKPTFSYAGLCGDRDMNYREMFDVKTYLDQLTLNNALFIFDGKHQWPPNEQLLLAFNWLEMEAIKKGHITKSKEEIQQRYLDDFNIAQTIEKNNQLLIASLHYDRILSSYDSFIDLDTVRQQLSTIKKSKKYSKSLKDRKRAFEKESVLNAFFLNRFDKDYQKPHKKSLDWWGKEFDKIEKQKAKANIQIVKMYERVLFNIFVTAYSVSNQDNSNISQAQRLFTESLISLVQSKL